MIQFREREIKNLALESLTKLRIAENKFKCISVCHNLTKAERDQCKKLIEEAKKNQAENQSGLHFHSEGPTRQYETWEAEEEARLEI